MRADSLMFMRSKTRAINCIAFVLHLLLIVTDTTTGWNIENARPDAIY